MDFSLSASNIEFLKKEISKSGLTYSHLMDELIDHVCCDVEHEMRNGLPFAKAYETVIDKIGIGGLERIQHETLYLIDKKYRIMKNTMKISGLIAPILLAFGALFKIQHWPWAGILLVLGFFLLSFVFLPSAIYVSYKKVSNRTRKWTHVIGFLGTFFISVGFLFKIQHWPYAGTAITTGILLTSLVFLPMVLNNRLKDHNDSVPKFIYLIAFSGFMIYLAAVLFKIMYWPFATEFLFTGCVLLVFIVFPLCTFHMYKDHQHISNGFIYTAIVIVWFVIPTTLISINLSRNIIRNAYEINQSMGKDLVFLQETNDAITADLKDNPLAVGVAEQADKLLIFIQDLKNGIKKNEMPGEIETRRLTDLVNEFETQSLSVSLDANYSSIIRKTLANSMKIIEQPYGDPAIMIHMLTFLQLNVGLAEQTALRQLHQAEKETSMRSTNKQ
jgi:hypothetical protein